MKKDKTNRIIILGSSPYSTLGGAGKVIYSYIDHYVRNNIKYIFLPIHNRKALKILRVVPIIFSVLKAISIRIKCNNDIIVIHHHHTSISDLFSFFLIKSIMGVDRKKCFITFHNPKHFQNLKHINELLNCKKSKLIVKRLLIKKLLYFIYFRIPCLLSGNFHFLNSINHEIVKNLIIKKIKVHILPNPLTDSQRLFLKKNLNKKIKEFNSENKLIGTYSLMRKGKRLDRAIRMLNNLPINYSLIIGGKGPEENRLKELVENLNLGSRVKFVGWINEDMKKNFFESINIFIITSDADTQSLVFLESLIYCKPVISVPNPVFKEIYPEGICAIYAKEADPISLADEVISFKRDQFSHKKSSKYILDQETSYLYAENLLK
tara:strand:+ start:615 stop:1748 length:1134 start_codon:yes stop_codon:yes gene_type:complete